MRSHRLGWLVVAFALGGCPRGGPPGGPVAGRAPCTPPMVAIHGVWVPRALTAMFEPGDEPANVVVGVRIEDQAPSDIGGDRLEPGTYARWDVTIRSLRDRGFAAGAAARLEQVTGGTATVDGDEYADAIRVTSRWHEAGSSRVLQLAGQPLNDDVVVVSYLCGRVGATTRMSLDEAAGMVVELDPTWLPGELLAALADRELFAVSTTTQGRVRSFDVDIAFDEASLARLRAALLAAGLEEQPVEDRSEMFATGSGQSIPRTASEEALDNMPVFVSADHLVAVELLPAREHDSLTLSIDIERPVDEAAR